MAVIANPSSAATSQAGQTATIEAQAQATVDAHEANRQATATVQAEAFAGLGWPGQFFESFDFPRHVWTLGAHHDDYASTLYSIENGKYIWESLAYQGVTIRSQYPSRVLGDFYASVEARRVSGTPGAQYGITFRDDRANYYMFGVSDDQVFGVFVYYDGVWKPLINFMDIHHIAPGEINRLTVIGTGPHFDFYINNELVADLDDDTLPAGHIGLSINLPAPSDTAVIEFDNFEIRAPHTNGDPSAP